MINIHQKNKALHKVLLFRFFGNFLIFLSIFFVIKTFAGPATSEIRYFVDNTILKKSYKLVPTSDAVKNGDKNTNGADDREPNPSKDSQLAAFFGVKTEAIIHPVDPTYSIVIPKIAANARVIKNVSPVDEDQYLESLKYGVAHASGTSSPGEGGNVFLFAHSTDYIWNVSTYNAVFYLLYKLEIDDEINVFYEGKRYLYLVSDKKTVSPDEVEHLVNTTPNEQLTLQTCWPPGTTLQRLLVFAKRKAI